MAVNDDADEDFMPIWSASQTSASASSSAPPVAAAAGASTLAGILAPELPPQTDLPAFRDQTRYEWPVMAAYNNSGKEQWPWGPVLAGFDGAQTILSGDINSYFFIAPERPRGGVKELAVHARKRVPGLQPT